MSSDTCGSDVAANNLFTNLVNASEFDIPAVDLSSVDFQIPDPTGNDLFADLNRLGEEDLTTRVPRGTGMFDALMEANKAHLQEEYSNGRLSGKDYAEAYVALTNSAMATAVQYLLSKDAQYYQTALVQKQAQAAQVAVIQAKVQLEETKARLVEQQLRTKTSAAQYAHTKLLLASEDARRCLTQAQEAQVAYETANVLPKQVEASTAQISKVNADKDAVLYSTANLLPQQLANLVADKNVKVYQVENVLPAQVANVTEDTTGKAYTNNNILPEQLENIREQVEANRAKTMDTRTNGTTPIAGSIGKQKELHSQQIDSYKRDAEWKVAKGLIDVWLTSKSMDENFPIPTGVDAGALNSAIATIRSNLSL